MVTKELVKPSLTGQLRKQISLNQDRGDRKSFGGDKWHAYGTDIESYEISFREVLNGSTILDLLKDRPFPVVIDLMGPSKAVSTLFKKFPDKQKLGLAVSLSDLRSGRQKERDEKLNVIQIAGDIMRSSTWNEIERKLQGHKADLIIERARAGLNYLPSDPRLFAMLLNKAWRLLSRENGILMAQIPGELRSQAKTWADSIRNNSKIDLSGNPRVISCLKIVKTPNSPEKLPF